MSTRTARERRQTAVDVAVVDYGLGNLRSVARGLERAGATVVVVDDPAALDDVDGIVLPGVGAFREGVENAGPFRDALLDAADAGTPLFGICLGMQMLLSTSEEAERAGQGDAEGLGLIPGTNVRFSGGQKVPHMGWNQLSVEREHPLVRGVDGEYVYFVHSYYAIPEDETAAQGVADREDGTAARATGDREDSTAAQGVADREDEQAVVATTDYDGKFPAVVADESGTVFGTQFHPEKSGEAGLHILRNFVDICSSRH